MKKSALILAAVLILTLSLTVGLSACNRVEEGFIHADGKVLIDGYGKPIGLMGTNLGGWLVQESYLVPTDVGGEYGQIDMMIELANQFGKEDAYRLISAYEDNWISEQDFANIKNMGFNCVRLPFTYLDIYDAIRENDGVFERVPYAELGLTRRLHIAKSTGFISSSTCTERSDRKTATTIRETSPSITRAGSCGERTRWAKSAAPRQRSCG